jgi:hypothetical protein
LKSGNGAPSQGIYSEQKASHHSLDTSNRDSTSSSRRYMMVIDVYLMMAAYDLNAPENSLEEAK